MNRGLVNCVQSALTQLAIVQQTRALHNLCQSSMRVQLLSAATNIAPRRYVAKGKRKVYPAIVDNIQVDKIQPVDNFKLDLDYTPVLGNKGPDLIEKIENVCVSKDTGRLFAVVHIDKQQRKITTEDLLVINGFFPPQIGDKIRLEKVLMVGGKDFTLTGTPLLSQDLVKVEATVIEKTLSNIKVHYEKVKKLQRFKLLQSPQTVIVINSIEVDPFALQDQQDNMVEDQAEIINS